MQCSQRFWHTEGFSGRARTDLDTKHYWESTAGQPGPRGILQGYITGPGARRLGSFDTSARIRFAMEQAKQVFPEAERYAETAAFFDWDSELWNRGANAWLRPGDGRAIWPHLATPEGRVHFAGEHTSTSLLHGSLQGALQSGIRAAKAINDAT